MNFGKHKGKPVRDVDHGFWRWLLDRDFPKHVLYLGYEATRQIERGSAPDMRDIALTTWALNYAKENP
jgi:hypothetical protein